MAKKPKKKKGSFGSSLEEVDANIASMEKERIDLADKVNNLKASNKENKRFGELDGLLVSANQQKTTFQPSNKDVTPEGGANFGTADNKSVVKAKDRPADAPVIDKKTVVGEGPKDAKPKIVLPPRKDNNVATDNPIAPDNSISPVQGGGQPVQPTAQPVDGNQVAPGAVNLGGGQPTDLGGVGIDAGVSSDPTQQIVQQTIAGVQRPQDGAGPSIDNAINQSTFSGGQGGFPPIKKKEDALIEMDRTLSLGMNDPINKGSSTGQLTGTRPIFVGGGDITPFHVLNNRKKGIQDAANKRAEETQAFLNQKPPILKDQRFQGNMNKQFFGSMNNSVAKAKEIYGEDWDTAIKDPSNPIGQEFVQNMANFDFIAGSSDQVTDKFAAIDKSVEDGEAIYSNDTLALRDEYQQLQGGFLDGSLEGAIDLAGKFEKLQGFASIDEIINDENIDIKGTVSGYASIADTDDGTGRITTTTKKTKYEDQIKVLAHELGKFQFKDAIRKGVMTEDDIFNNINSKYGYESVTTKGITNKPSDAGLKVQFDLGGDFGNPRPEKFSDFQTQIHESVEIPTNVKPSSAVGISYYDGGGNLVQETGSQEVDWNSFQVVDVADPNNPGKTIKKKVVVGTSSTTNYDEKTKKDVTTTTTKAYDFDVVKERLLTDGVADPEQMTGIEGKLDAKMGATNLPEGGTAR